MRRRLRALWLDLADWIADDPTRLDDAFLYGGYLVATLGVGLIFVPAALVMLGLGFAILGILRAKVWAAMKRRRPGGD